MSTAPCICMFSSLYLPSMGGVQTYTASIAQALLGMGCRVIVVTCALEGNAGITEEEGVEVARIPCKPLLAGRYPLPARNAEAEGVWNWINEQCIDFIEVHTRFYPLSAQALAFAQRRGVVPIVLEHGSAHLTMGNPAVDEGVQAVEHFMTRRCLKHPAHYYAVSRKASAWLKHFGIDSCGELPNSIDAEAYAQAASQRDFRKQLGVSPDTLLVSFIGRLVPEKGVMTLAQASSMLANDNVLLALGGTGPLEEKLKQFEGKSFRLLGRLERPDVAALLSQSDLMCLPSRSEGFATSLLEAAACSTPSLVTDVGGTDELIPSPEYGIILPDASAKEVAVAVQRASTRRNALKKMGSSAKDLVRANYSWTATAKKTLAACRMANADRQSSGSPVA